MQEIAITGAGSGVGAALARVLARPGRRLSLLARRAATLEAVAADVRAAGAEADVRPCDVADAEAVERALPPRLHALVNAAALPAGTVEGASAAEVAQVIGVNLVGTMLCARAAAPRMGAGGTIVNVGSLCVRVKDGGASLYVAAKLGVAGFTDAFRKEVAGRGIRVVLVNPGQIASGMVTETPAERAAAVAREAMLLPEEVAETIRWALELPPRVVVTELEVRPRGQSGL